MSNLKRLKEKYTLITGASKGIGYELANIFAQNKFNLILVARSEDKLAEIAKELIEKYNINCYIFAADLSSLDNVKKLYNKIQNKGLDVSVLVNNAGFGKLGLFHKTDIETEIDMINLNITTVTFLTKLFLQDMIKMGYGKIMNVASTAAFQPGPYMSVYYASKAYVLSFSEALASELNNLKISISTLCPGPTDTNFQDVANMKKVKLFESEVMKAETVAKVAYKGLLKGKRIIIPGIQNKLLATSSKLMPSKAITEIVKKLQSPN
ncbi:SDR family NAD(P)-dependent oxidoreductase [Orenia marismortui]|uniref:SDR family NAD(P)-dependent oxidoreductase n=1 Tax=Orenia marismortui TaxID=46469 RepID=UPI000364F8E7|nr:SDR family oxidoreductase [Orenia marismortui]